MSGKAHIVYEEGEGAAPDFEARGRNNTGKHVRIDVLSVVEAKGATPLRMRLKELSPFNPPLPKISHGTIGEKGQQQVEEKNNHLMRCTEVLDVASGVKSFRFEPVAAGALAGSGGGDGESKDAPTWTPGQVIFCIFICFLAAP